jgi:hypothetical protein
MAEDKAEEATAWAGGNRDVDPFNPEDVKQWQERDRQAAEILSEINVGKRFKVKTVELEEL